MKLFAFLSRTHKPDIDALSALVDGALDAASARDLEAHVAGCAVCAAEFDGLRRVKSMLAALPQREPSRSFRVRLADVETPARRASAPAGGLVRAMPALAAAAAFVFVAVLATDFSTRDGGRDAREATSLGGAQESIAMDRAAEGQADEDATIANSGGALAGELAGTPVAASAPAGQVAPLPTDASEPPTSDFFAGEPDDAGRDGSGTAIVEPDNQMDELDAARAATSDDDDGNRTAFLAVEIIAALIAIGAAAAFVASRRSV